MPEHRIRIPKHHQEFIQQLMDSDTGSGPFRTQADVLAFAAALGAQHDQFEAFEEHNEPIRQEVFARAGYDTLINLLSVHKANDPNVLSNVEDMESQRITIFENYANGGLYLLENELKGEVDYLKGLLLILKKHRSKPEDDIEGIDITRFLE